MNSTIWVYSAGKHDYARVCSSEILTFVSNQKDFNQTNAIVQYGQSGPKNFEQWFSKGRISWTVVSGTKLQMEQSGCFD